MQAEMAWKESLTETTPYVAPQVCEFLFPSLYFSFPFNSLAPSQLSLTLASVSSSLPKKGLGPFY